MGYCISLREANFHIKKSNVPQVLKAIHNLATQTNKGSGCSGSTPSFSWVNTDELVECKTGLLC